MLLEPGAEPAAAAAAAEDEPEAEEPPTGPTTNSGRRCDATKELLSGDAEFISNNKILKKMKYKLPLIDFQSISRRPYFRVRKRKLITNRSTPPAIHLRKRHRHQVEELVRVKSSFDWLAISGRRCLPTKETFAYRAECLAQSEKKEKKSLTFSDGTRDQGKHQQRDNRKHVVSLLRVRVL